jgi:hypothetical protein
MNAEVFLGVFVFMTLSPDVEVLDAGLIPGQPDLFPDLNLVELARAWEPEQRREFAHTGATVSKNAQLCDAVCEAVLLRHSVREIARAFRISRHSVTAIMGVLEARGKVEPIKRRLGFKLGDLAEECADDLIEAVRNRAVPHNVVAIAMGIALDKKAMLDAEPVGVVAVAVQEELRIENVNALVRSLGLPIGPAALGPGPVAALPGADKKGAASDSESGGNNE